MKKSVGFALFKKVPFFLVFLFSSKVFSVPYYLSSPPSPVGWNGSSESEIDSQLAPMIVLAIVFAFFYIKKHIRE